MRDQIGMEPRRTAFRSPSQNGLAERWIGTVRRELLDHMVGINEEHRRRILLEDVEYYNREHVHTRLRDAPAGRSVEERPFTPKSTDSRVSTDSITDMRGASQHD